MSTINFTMSDLSTQTLTLTDISNVAYADLIEDDGSTTIQVPLFTFYLADGTTVTTDILGLVLAILTSNMNNDSPFVMGGVQHYDAVVTPKFGHEKVVNTFKFTKNIEITGNRAIPYYEIDLTSGSLPTGLQLINDGSSYKVEGNVEPLALSGYVNFDPKSQEGLSTARDLDLDRELIFFNIVYVTGSGFQVGDVIVDEVTGDDTTIKRIEIYTYDDVVRTKFVVDKYNKGNEFSHSDSSASIKNGQVDIDDSWLGYFKSGDGTKRVSFDNFGHSIPTTETTTKDYPFQLGIKESGSSSYTDTQDYTLKVSQNWDSVRDEFTLNYDTSVPVQPEFDLIHQNSFVYSYTDVVFADFVLPFRLNSGVLDEIDVIGSELTFNRYGNILSSIPITDGEFTIYKNVSGVKTKYILDLG